MKGEGYEAVVLHRPAQYLAFGVSRVHLLEIPSKIHPELFDSIKLNKSYRLFHE
jgi:hypothetical protein